MWARNEEKEKTGFCGERILFPVITLKEDLPDEQEHILDISAFPTGMHRAAFFASGRGRVTVKPRGIFGVGQGGASSKFLGTGRPGAAISPGVGAGRGGACIPVMRHICRILVIMTPQHLDHR